MALRRKASLFVGSDSGISHGAIAMAPLQTAKLNGAEPMTWLTYALAPIAEHLVIRMKPSMPGALLGAIVRRIKAAMAWALPWEGEFAVARARRHRLIQTGQGIVTVQDLPTLHERAARAEHCQDTPTLFCEVRLSWDLVR
jgi:hypothetical protein